MSAVRTGESFERTQRTAPPETRRRRQCTASTWAWDSCTRTPGESPRESQVIYLAGRGCGTTLMSVSVRRREQVQAAEAGGMDAHHEPEMDHPRIRHRWCDLHHHRDRGPNHVWIGLNPAPSPAPSPALRHSPREYGEAQRHAGSFSWGAGVGAG